MKLFLFLIKEHLIVFFLCIFLPTLIAIFISVLRDYRREKAFDKPSRGKKAALLLFGSFLFVYSICTGVLLYPHIENFYLDHKYSSLFPETWLNSVVENIKDFEDCAYEQQEEFIRGKSVAILCHKGSEIKAIRNQILLQRGVLATGPDQVRSIIIISWKRYPVKWTPKLVSPGEAYWARKQMEAGYRIETKKPTHWNTNAYVTVYDLHTKEKTAEFFILRREGDINEIVSNEVTKWLAKVRIE